MPWKQHAIVTGNIRTKSIVEFFLRRLSAPSTGLRGSVLAALLILCAGLAACHRNQPWHDAAAGQRAVAGLTPNSCNLSEQDAFDLNGDPSTDVHSEHDYRATISRMLQEEKFEALDCIADQTRSSKERFAGGAWKLHQLYKGLYEPAQYPVTHPTQEDWDEFLQRLQHWVTARPKSVTARVALASAYIGYARDVRGEGDASTVSDGAWKLFRERTGNAERILKQAGTLRSKCPEWYVAALKLAETQNWDAPRRRRLFEKAFKSDPDYYYSAGTFASSLLPKRGGKVGDAENFLQQVAHRFGGSHGDIYYFQVANTPNLLCGCDQDPHLSWERIERGFEASEKQYGVSLLTLNQIAFLAAHYGKLDPIFAEKAFTRIGDQWNQQTWEREEDFDSAKDWATRWVPAMANQQALEAQAEANLHTPEGSRYAPLLAREIRDLMRQCVPVQGPTVGTLETLTNVGTNGTVEAVAVNGPGGVCVYQKLLSLQGDRTKAFPPPPRAPYWVKLDLDWAEVSQRLEK